MYEDPRERELPEIGPDIQEVPPTPDTDEKPEISPEERQRIIDQIDEEEQEEREHERAVDEIIQKKNAV